MKTLLITGFDPFDGAQINPSWEAVSCLPEQIGSFRLHKLALPTLYRKAPQLLLEECARLHPDAVLSIGQAAGRDAVTPERIAVNIRAAKIADNEGTLLDGERIDPEGPAAYFSTFPAEAIRDSIRAAGIPAAVSNTAGTFVCNDVLYSALHHYSGTNVPCGFIHVPQLPEQGSPSLPLEHIVHALVVAIQAWDKA